MWDDNNSIVVDGADNDDDKQNYEMSVESINY